MSRFAQLQPQSPLVVPIIMILNGVVFFLWLMDPYQSLEGPMAKNFLVSWTALSQGRIWILITSVFSHNMFLHLFINMFVLNSFGSFLEQVLGRFRFLKFYLLAGIFGSLSHSLVSAFLIGQPAQPALGASGAIAGLILLFSFLFPKEKILILGIIPVSAIWGALAFIGLDLWGLIAQTQGGGLPIGHGAHLGGAFTGIFYYFILRKSSKGRHYSF